MISYRDRSYCTREDCAYFATCDRALTDNVRKGAQKLQLPICVAQFQDCFAPAADSIYKRNENNT